MSCEGDDCQMYSENWVRARKDHDCTIPGCHARIPRGHRYVRWMGVYAREVSFGKRCATCQAVYDLLNRVSTEGAVAWELNCGHSWEESFGDLPPEVAALAFMTPEEAQALRG